MPVVDSAHPLGQLLRRDPRYKLDAYLFVLESLSFAQESLGMGAEPPLEDLEPARGAADAPAKPRARPGKTRFAARMHGCASSTSYTNAG